MASIFLEVSLIFFLATVFGAILRGFKQPLIIAYILTGIIVGPYLLNFVESAEILEILSHIGIAFLLFLVGINLNVSMLKEVGKVALVTGIGQVTFTFLLGFLMATAFGFDVVASAFIALGLTFSSTIIIMKLLSDKDALDSLYGRISIGFLLVQDFVAVTALLLVSSLASGVSSLSEILIESFGSLALALVVLYFLSRYLLPFLAEFSAKSQEFLLLFSITWCFVLASAFYYLGFGLEIGALFAGITLASTSYKFEIASKMKPIRDFFLIMFFIVLGSNMVLDDIAEYFVEALVFSLLILVGNPLIVMSIMGFLGYTKRTSFNAGLTVAQISEFSLILVGMGVGFGYLGTEILSIVTLIALITIAGSTYMIMYSNAFYNLLSPVLGVFERKGKKIDQYSSSSHDNHDIILFGYGKLGFDILKSLNSMKKEFLVVDYDPKVIEELSRKGVSCKYGDAEDYDLLEELNLRKLKIMVSSIADTEANLLLLDTLRQENSHCVFIAVSHGVEDALELYKQGADYVILPHYLGGHHASALLEKYMENPSEIISEKLKHLKYLSSRKNS